MFAWQAKHFELGSRVTTYDGFLTDEHYTCSLLYQTVRSKGQIVKNNQDHLQVLHEKRQGWAGYYDFMINMHKGNCHYRI